MLELVQSSIPEVVQDATEETVVIESPVVELVDVDGDEIVTEALSVDTVFVSVASEVYVPEVDTQLLEAAMQGPVGPAGPAGALGGSYAGKTLTRTGELLTDVWLYLDAAKTQLGEHRVLNYISGVLTSINYFDSVGSLTKTRTLTYSSGALIGATDT